MTTFAHMNKKDRLQSGEFRYMLTGVEYGHDGIKNLKYYVPDFVHANLFGFAVTGSWTFDRRYDDTERRAPFRATCTGTGVAKIHLRFRLPQEFGSFPTAALELAVNKSGGTINHVQATLRRGVTADATINASDIEPVGAGWEYFALTPGTAYGRCDWMSLEISIDAVAGEDVEFSDLSLAFMSGRGNAHF